MKFRTDQQGAVTVISLQGSLMGGPDASELKNKVHDLIDEGKNLVVVDLAGVGIVNSSGLGTLIASATTLKGAGGKMLIAGASKKVRELIKITRLSPILRTEASVREAVDTLKQ